MANFVEFEHDGNNISVNIDLISIIKIMPYTSGKYTISLHNRIDSESDIFVLANKADAQALYDKLRGTTRQCSDTCFRNIDVIDNIGNCLKQLNENGKINADDLARMNRMEQDGYPNPFREHMKNASIPAKESEKEEKGLSDSDLLYIKRLEGFGVPCPDFKGELEMHKHYLRVLGLLKEEPATPKDDYLRHAKMQWALENLEGARQHLVMKSILAGEPSEADTIIENPFYNPSTLEEPTIPKPETVEFPGAERLCKETYRDAADKANIKLDNVLELIKSSKRKYIGDTTYDEKVDLHTYMHVQFMLGLSEFDVSPDFPSAYGLVLLERDKLNKRLDQIRISVLKLHKMSCTDAGNLPHRKLCDLHKSISKIKAILEDKS